jgi:hypothetical protein
LANASVNAAAAAAAAAALREQFWQQGLVLDLQAAGI